MKIKKKIWGCLLSLLCIFMLVLPVMASESPETDSEVSELLETVEAVLLSPQAERTSMAAKSIAVSNFFITYLFHVGLHLQYIIPILQKSRICGDGYCICRIYEL